MDSKYKVGGYVKLAKLWERSKDAVVAYHSSYYAEKFKDDTDKELFGVYIDITGNKEIFKRPEMVHLLRDCKKGKINLISSQTRAYSVSTSNSELHRLLLDCNETEQAIITRMAKELKATLVSLGI